MCFNHTPKPKTTTATVKVESAIPSKNRRNFVKTLAVGGAVAASGSTLASCATNAATGRKQFIGLAPGGASLSNMAAASWAELKQKTPTSNDPRYTRRLQNIGGRISKGANRADQAWDYAVFDDETKNAFVLPGNRVGFYKGMMDFTDNDDQIAGIMGHEVGHVAGEHARERMSLNMISQAAVVGGSVLGSTQFSKKCKSVPANQRQSCMNSANRNAQMLVAALGIGTQIGLVLPYSRRHESESDLLGVNYMYKAGYNPYEAVRLWEKMAADNPSRQPEFLSTHPDPRNRAENINNYIKRQEKMGSQGFVNINT
jgi:predicted Zn-dependent protease